MKSKSGSFVLFWLYLHPCWKPVRGEDGIPDIRIAHGAAALRKPTWRFGSGWTSRLGFLSKREVLAD
jgi:hypothetical protein